MTTRAAAAEATRERILEVAAAAFTSQWYEDVTLRAIASDAGVALQTVVNHFGTKDALFAEAIERWGDRVESVRFSIPPGDTDLALSTVVDDYDRYGDAILRFLAMEERVPVVHEPLERGRRGHEQWTATMFAGALKGLRGAARQRRLAQLVVATDVYSWKLLRRDRGFSREQTIQAMRELVLALHHDPEGGSR